MMIRRPGHDGPSHGRPTASRVAMRVFPAAGTRR